MTKTRDTISCEFAPIMTPGPFFLEHRDKKGFTPLILGATAGHDKVVDILLEHKADIEAQSERTKDTPLSLACSGGR